MSKSISLRLPEELRQRIDKARGLVPRERWIRQSIEMRLANQRMRKEVARR